MLSYQIKEYLFLDSFRLGKTAICAVYIERRVKIISTII